jgi:molecular chaperone IbpA
MLEQIHGRRLALRAAPRRRDHACWAFAGVLQAARDATMSFSRRPDPAARFAIWPGSGGSPFSHVASEGGYAMRHFDLSPLYRSTVGFDRLFSLLDQAGAGDASTGYPPYNIERTGEDAYRITVAVAGFGPDDLSIEAKENALSIHGEKKASAEDRAGDYLYQGIAARAFERRFQLADHVQVNGASLENGLLHVDLVREVPEAKKPRLIPIAAKASPVIEAASQAA